MTRKSVFITVGAVLGSVAIWAATPDDSSFKRTPTWQRLASPGDLSQAHASLEDNCAACHTSVAGIRPSNCIVCHANDESILRRQPTSFHVSIGSCVECHFEHRGRSHRPTNMDHAALSRIGLRQLHDGNARGENEATRAQLLSWVRSGPAVGRRVQPLEAVLNCATCHANDDRHFDLFGSDCAQCHATDRWTIPEFRHPSASSMDCAQCHQAPPSHYMMHFKMISARVAGQPHARVDQCYQCHQTTSWNDILGTGWYKHH